MINPSSKDYRKICWTFCGISFYSLFIQLSWQSWHGLQKQITFRLFSPYFCIMRNLVYLMQENFSQVQLPKVLNPLPWGPIQRGLRIRRSTKRLKYCMTMDVHYIYLVLQLHPPSYTFIFWSATIQIRWFKNLHKNLKCFHIYLATFRELWWSYCSKLLKLVVTAESRFLPSLPGNSAEWKNWPGSTKCSFIILS